MNRRALLGGGLAAAALPASLRAERGRARLAEYPFALGVASGYPRPDGFVLWTRLAPEPLAPAGGLWGRAPLPVAWEIATDPQLRRVVLEGTAWASGEWAHSVHVEPVGLEPGREYWYRFRAAGHESPVGRTRTAPAPGTMPQRLRLAVASCQQYEHGYYAAYRHMVADEPDLVLHLGDYIYELSWGEDRVRSHGAGECYTLEDYRARHALYRGDLDLQAAHAACPWLVTWDDHEVDNDYADDVSEEDDPPGAFLVRRAAAYQAYYEHMPLPRRAVSLGNGLRLHASRMHGDLAQLIMLDGRQYRSPHACPPPGRRGGRSTWCEEIFRPDRSMLGAAQEAWFEARLGDSGSRWNIVAQQTVMTRVDEQPGPGERFWTDAWNGYPAARERFMNVLANRRPANPVVLSGDIHAFGVAELNERAADRESPIVATEFITTSISSQGVADKLAGQLLAENPNLRFGEARYRGYLRIDLTPATLRADLVALDDPRRRDSGRRTLSSWVVESGRPGPVLA